MKKPKGKLATVAAGITTAQVAYSLFNDVRARYREKYCYTVSVDSNAYIFLELMQWLVDETETNHTRIKSNYGGIKRTYNQDGKSRISYGGFTYEVTTSKPDTNVSQVVESFADTFMKSQIVFTCRKKAGIDVLIRKFEELTEKRKLQEKEVQILTLNSTYWNGNRLSYRDINSIFLPPGVKESLLTDISDFFDNEKKYERIGAPWHRGYLLYGPPGNGKSSLVSAIANLHKMNLYSLSLSALKDDEALMTAINRIESRSILLLEDVDVFSHSVTRDKDGDGLTLAGLLNALDGVATPHGLMTFMTTNHVENLDEALIRAGRMDKKVHLVAPTDYQIHSMFEWVYDDVLEIDTPQFPSMAEFVNILKMHPEDPQAARLAIKEYEWNS